MKTTPPYREVLEVARLAGFSAEELDLYVRAKLAELEARGALSLAFRQGYEAGFREGFAEGFREAVRALCQALEIEFDADREAILAGMGLDALAKLQALLLRERRWG